MPPKRSRRKLKTLKDPLDFVESPVNFNYHMPSPVLPSDHPAYAEVVPVDLGTSVWVSPQFQRKYSVAEKRRRNRETQRSGKHGPNSANHTGTVVQGALVNKDYVPLRMVGQEVDECVQTREEEQRNSTPTILTRAQAKLQSTADVRIPSVTRVLKPLNTVSPRRESMRDFTQVRPKEHLRMRPQTKLTFSESGSDSDESPTKPTHHNNVQNGNEWDSFCAQAFGEVTTPEAYVPKLGRIESFQLKNLPKKTSTGLFAHIHDSPIINSVEQGSGERTVLVHDTPESEYGKNLKWRQIHNRIS